MNQIVKDKMQREIMVVNNTKLFEGINRETKFYVQDEFNFEKRIVDSYEYMVRGKAEEDFDYKQPLPYGVVIDQNDKIFVYQRGGAGSNAGERRLHSKISFGVGGHIEREDENANDILRDTLRREIEEEINVSESDIHEVDILGYINIDNKLVEEFHFGLAYIVRVKNTNIELLDGELANGEFVTYSTLEGMLMSGNYDLELWSQILMEPLKKYLNK